MKLYYYDIWDGNKGVIFADSEKEAVAIFRSAYKNVPIFPDDVDEYDSGIACIDFITDSFKSIYSIP